MKVNGYRVGCRLREGGCSRSHFTDLPPPTGSHILAVSLFHLSLGCWEGGIDDPPIAKYSVIVFAILTSYEFLR